VVEEGADFDGFDEHAALLGWLACLGETEKGFGE
jgi:hypothetical protein